MTTKILGIATHRQPTIQEENINIETCGVRPLIELCSETLEELINVKGFGPVQVEKYGKDIIEICANIMKLPQQKKRYSLVIKYFN